MQNARRKERNYLKLCNLCNYFELAAIISTNRETKKGINPENITPDKSDFSLAFQRIRREYKMDSKDNYS